MVMNAVKSRLLEWFCGADTFSIFEDTKKLFPDSADIECDRLIVRLALGLLEERQIVAKCDADNFWVLVQPLNQHTRTLKLNARTTTAIAKTVNFANKQIGEEYSEADPLAITELDIQKLVFLCEFLLKRKAIEPREHEEPTEQQKAIGFGV